MSIRDDLQAEAQLALMSKGCFDAPYGIIGGLSKDKKYRSITFGVARALDAELRIYSPSFILVRWQGGVRDMPHKGTEKFHTLRAALAFIDDRMTY